jgi:spermidine synthase
MSLRFEELAWADTPIGELSLRRRVEPTLGVELYEVKLGEEYLMSSLFTAAEEALARLGLAAVGDARAAGPLDVVVGGLGLGHTAVTVLEDPRVATLTVVDALPAVVQWHRDALLPCSAALLAHPGTRLVVADFFAAAAADGFDPELPGRRVDAVLVDIDHSPRHLLDSAHATFYTGDGLRAAARFLRPGGVFGLWSDDPPDPPFVELLEDVLDGVVAHVVEFANPLTGGRSANTVYVGQAR